MQRGDNKQNNSYKFSPNLENENLDSDINLLIQHYPEKKAGENRMEWDWEEEGTSYVLDVRRECTTLSDVLWVNVNAATSTSFQL